MAISATEGFGLLFSDGHALWRFQRRRASACYLATDMPSRLYLRWYHMHYTLELGCIKCIRICIDDVVIGCELVMFLDACVLTL